MIVQDDYSIVFYAIFKYQKGFSEIGIKNLITGILSQGF